ncbi:MAG: hypothetical protein WDO24_21645 [Pseudomonadota bacterium]
MARFLLDARRFGEECGHAPFACGARRSRRNGIHHDAVIGKRARDGDQAQPDIARHARHIAFEGIAIAAAARQPNLDSVQWFQPLLSAMGQRRIVEEQPFVSTDPAANKPVTGKFDCG